MRQGFVMQDVLKILKQAFVDVALEEYGIRGRPTSKSRIAALTGLTRMEVAQLVQNPSNYLEQSESKNPLSRVIGHWLRDPNWLNEDNTPRTLLVDDAKSGFPALVKRVGGDIPYQTILRELDRLNLVKLEDNNVTLIKHGYIPEGDDLSLLPFIGEDIPALIDTIDFNIKTVASNRRFQRKVAFPGLTKEGLKYVQQIAETEGQKLLEAADKNLSVYALQDGETTHRQTGIGIYVFDIEHSSHPLDK